MDILIEDLPIKYGAVATDLNRKKEVVDAIQNWRYFEKLTNGKLSDFIKKLLKKAWEN